jgi:hypothetical protein
MTTHLVRTIRRAAIVSTLALLPSVAAAQDALLRLDHLAELAAQARETVDLTIPPEVLQLATAFISPDDPNQAEIKELIANLKGVYVKSFRFDREGGYNQGHVDAIHQQLAGWARIVNVQEPSESLGVYMLQENGQTNGLAVVIAQPRELTVVNIVGPIDLQKLAAIAGKFGIPQLPIGAAPQ